MIVAMVVGKLSTAERRLQAALKRRDSIDFRTGDILLDEPSGGGSWGENRQIRAEVLAAMLTEPETATHGQLERIFIRGARILGSIDLKNSIVEAPIWLDKCHVDDGIDMTNAVIPALIFRSCYLGPVRLDNARLGGLIDLSGTQ